METPSVIHPLHYEEPVQLLPRERAEHADGFSLTVNGTGHRRAKDGDYRFVAVQVEYEGESDEFLIYLQRPVRDSRTWKEWTITMLGHKTMPPPARADTKVTLLVTRGKPQ